MPTGSLQKAMAHPVIYLFGGSNGAGKTTFARAFLPHELAKPRFLNADEIARGLSPFSAESMALKAGRLMLSELHDCIEARRDFGMESTLSGKTYVGLLTAARAEGYVVELHYFWLPSAQLAIRRVRQRVRKGGHSVPEEDIRRRYERSFAHLQSDYLPLADRWRIWNNGAHAPLMIAASEDDSPAQVAEIVRSSRAPDFRPKTRKPAPLELTSALAAGRRMGRIVRDENRRFGLPLVVTPNRQ